ncbi:MAG: hypothetical protein EOO69_09665 [Moraxellaceae bacterium]|nr:MAG: hypothetical protein EOO69_09665 [Moraxellaceae bacterium]
MTMGCKRCDKKGVAIFLARYSIGSHSTYDITKTLPIAKKFPALPDSYHYTLQCLQNGYLYIYDELDKSSIRAFKITGAYYTEVDLKYADAINTSFEKKHQACMQNIQKLSNAMLVAIPKPDVSRSIYISYSPYKWTKSTYENHIKNSKHRAHMKEVKIGAKNENAYLLNNLNLVVANFSAKKNQNPFEWSPNKFYSYKGLEDSIIKEANKLSGSHTPIIVPIHDPINLMADISSLLDHLQIELRKTNNRKLALAGLINQVKFIIQESKKNEATTAFNSQISSVFVEDTEQVYNTNIQDYIEVKTYKKTHENPIIRYTSAQLKELERRQKIATEDLWEKYNDQLVEPDIQDKFLKSFGNLVKKLDSDLLTPLAKVHVEWLKNTDTSNYFLYNFDSKNITDGVNYTASITKMLGNTQDNGVCFSYYMELLEGDVADHTNYIFSALLFNQEKNKKAIKNIQSQFDFFNGLTGPAWATFLGTLTSVQDVKLDNYGKSIELFFNSISKPTTKTLFGSLRSKNKTPPKIVNSVALALGAHYKKAIVPIKFNGNIKDFVDDLAEQILLHSGQSMKGEKLASYVKLHLHQLQLAGLKNPNDLINHPVLVAIDLDDITKLHKVIDSSNSERGPKMAASIKDMEEIRQIVKSRADLILKQQGNLATSFGIFTGVLQGASTFGYFDSLLKDGSRENQIKFAGSWLAGVGVMSDMAERRVRQSMINLSEQLAKSHLKTAQSLALIKNGGFIISAAIFGYFDVRSGVEEFREYNNPLMGNLYLASAALGVGAAFWFAGSATAASTVYGILVAAVLAGIGLAILYFKNNELQNWLRKTYWGKANNNSTLESEINQLNDIINQLNQQAA